MTSILLKIHSLSSEGDGIGSLNGMKVFVEGALPGEEVLITLALQKKNYAIGKLQQIISPSSERISPPCPLFGHCGGCQLMHLNYQTQLEVKRQKVSDAFKKIAGIQDVEILPCLPSPLSLGYRNKIQIPFLWENGKKTFGLYRKNSHEIIPLKRCLIQSSFGEKLLHFIAENLDIPSVRYVLIRNAIFTNEALIVFITNGEFFKELKKLSEELKISYPSIQGVVENLKISSTNSLLGPTFRLLTGQPFIHEHLLGKVFKISPSAFFQVNPIQTEILYKKALEFAEICSTDKVLDAYCGVGALSILAADKTKSVHGIESVPQAIIDAKTNAQLNQATHCQFTCGKTEEKIQKETFNVCFLNPPRKGCDPKVIQSLIEKKVEKIVYISCDPATLARDVALLKKAYRLNTIQPIDMFPQTMHVETVIRLTSYE